MSISMLQRGSRHIFDVGQLTAALYILVCVEWEEVDGKFFIAALPNSHRWCRDGHALFFAVY